MKGDFSRLPLDSYRYSGVLMQQGRVMVDSDWNDLVALLTEAHREFVLDLVGPHGAPCSNGGFEIGTAGTANEPDLSIGRGVYYVDGIRVLAGGAVDDDETLLYSAQPYPSIDDDTEMPAPPILVYLDLWERHVTALENIAIREVALGGPDTTTRTEVVWQVKIASLSNGVFEDFDIDADPFDLAGFRSRLTGNRPRLKVTTDEPSTDDDPCVSSPEAKYRGVENQLYRVEIHHVDDEEQTFVWSRENGCVVAAWLSTGGETLRVSGVRDKVHGFEPGDWVELTHDDLELRREHGVLVRLTKVDGDELTFDPATRSGEIDTNPSQLPNAKVRRWDQRERGNVNLVGGAVPIEEATGDTGWIPLEDGIKVQFQLPDGDNHTYQVGDYWVFAARVATGTVQWPTDGAGNPRALPPRGVVHHYAPLASVALQEGEGSEATDLRRVFDIVPECPP